MKRSLLSSIQPLLLLLLLMFWGRTSGADVDPGLPFSEYLDSSGGVLLRWGFDPVKDSITFEVTANTSGWVGFGFSPNGGMAGSDIVIGGVGPEGKYFTDRNAAGNFMPALDQEQNFKVLSLTEANGQTVMKFQRSIKACDKNDFYITDMPVKLIYAYGDTDDISYHRNQRGTKEVNLLNYMPRSTIPDSKYFDLTMTNFTIPTTTTYYQCKIMSLPVFDRKYHIYRIEPVIQNRDMVHHLLLYRCPPSVNQTSEKKCYSKDTLLCIQAVAVWAVGGGAFEFPEVAGLPVGDGGNETFYRLEVHYNNQQLTPGIVDNSGLRFYYTARLRKYDAAIMQTGLHVTVGVGYMIPPNATNFLTYGICDTTFFPQVLPQVPDELQVFAGIMHTHLAGRKVRVGHFRNGEQIDYLALNEHYNFEFQQVTNMGKTKTIKLGDSIVVECTYDTTDRTGPTWGGLGTNNEMCLAFLFYYPALNLSFCSSLPNGPMVMKEMGAANLTAWLQLIQTKVWDNSSILEYQQILKKIQQDTIIANLNEYNLNLGKISELKLSPSTNCLRSRAEIKCAVTEILLLALMLSLIFLC